MMKSRDQKFLDDYAARTASQPNWFRIGVLGAIRIALDAVRLGFTSPAKVLSFFENPNAEFRLCFRWDDECFQPGQWHSAERRFVVEQLYEDRSQMVDVVLRYADWYARTTALVRLTLDSAYVISGGRRHRSIAPALSEDLLGLPEDEAQVTINAAFEPVSLAAFLGADDYADDVQRWRRAAGDVQSWDVTASGATWEVPLSLFPVVEPLVVDKDRKEAFFTVKVGLAPLKADLTRLGLWSAGALQSLWTEVQAALDRELEGLGAVLSHHRGVLEPQDVSPIILSEVKEIGRGEGGGATISSVALTELTEDVAFMRREIASIGHRLGAASPSAKRLSVDLAGPSATLDGRDFPLTEAGAQVLKILLDRTGKPTGPNEFKEAGYVGRHDRVIKKLPPPLRDLITRKTGSGCCLTLT